MRCFFDTVTNGHRSNVPPFQSSALRLTLLRCRTWKHCHAFAAGQMGDGTINDRLTGPGPQVPLGGAYYAVDLSISEQITCVLQDDGALRCWGKNDFGQLGLGHTTTPVTSPTTPISMPGGRNVATFSASNQFLCAPRMHSLVIVTKTSYVCSFISPPPVY